MCVTPGGSRSGPDSPAGWLVAVEFLLRPAGAVEHGVFASTPRYRLSDVSRAVDFGFSFNEIPVVMASTRQEQTEREAN